MLLGISKIEEVQELPNTEVEYVDNDAEVEEDEILRLNSPIQQVEIKKGLYITQKRNSPKQATRLPFVSVLNARRLRTPQIFASTFSTAVHPTSS